MRVRGGRKRRDKGEKWSRLRGKVKKDAEKREGKKTKKKAARRGTTKTEER